MNAHSDIHGAFWKLETIEAITPDPPSDLAAIRSMTREERDELYRRLMAEEMADIEAPGD